MTKAKIVLKSSSSPLFNSVYLIWVMRDSNKKTFSFENEPKPPILKARSSGTSDNILGHGNDRIMNLSKNNKK